MKVSIPQASEDPLFIKFAVIVALPTPSNWTVISWQVAFGFTLSSTTIIPIQLALFPLTSIAVNWTELIPISSQSNEYKSRYIVSIPQASVDPLFIISGEMDTFPNASKSIIKFWHKTDGGTLSSTWTFAEQSDALPFSSVTVNVTVLDPTLSQSKFEGFTAIANMPQLSVELAFTISAVILAKPLMSNWTIISWHKAIGGILSSTTTVASQSELFPLSSTAVIVMLLTPILEQSKSYWLRNKVSNAQSSKDPLSTWLTVILTAPKSSRATIISWQSAVGAISSSTSTVAEHWALFPLKSITVKTTEFKPTFEQSKL